MTPGRASASGFHYSDSCAGEGDPCIGDNDPFLGYGTEGGSASVCASRWGDVAIVKPEALESPFAFYSPGYDASLLSPTFLFEELPGSIDRSTGLPADIGQLSVNENEVRAISPPSAIRQVSVNEAGAISPPGGIHPLSVDESVPSPEPAHSPELAKKLRRKRSHRAKQMRALAASKKTADRTVQIADFSWTLPPDPGKGGPYPSLIFLIGAAISSRDSGTMRLAEIRQWIRARYPSRPVSADCSIRSALRKRTDFVDLRTGKRDIGLWRLRDPQQLRGYYEKGVFLKQRCGIGSRDRAFRNPLPVAEQGDPGATVPALPVRFGSHVLTLPPHSAGQKKPPMRLLCGCAIVLGSEQGASIQEITEWIAGRYSIQQANAVRTLNKRVQSVLSSHDSDFRRTNKPAPNPAPNPAPGKSKRGYVATRWVLNNPADFAARYGGCIRSQDS